MSKQIGKLADRIGIHDYNKIIRIPISLDKNLNN